VHGGLAYSPLTWAHVKDAWVWIIDSLKPVLETGRQLPAPEMESDAQSAASTQASPKPDVTPRI